jgi:putative ABC transport system ATP-binding protein
MSNLLISIENISFQYKPSTEYVLSNINMSIYKGDYIAIVGTSGSGKSTLLSILGLLNIPSNGVYSILGVDTQNLTSQAIAEIKNNEIGFIFQNFNLLTQLNVFDNVSLPLVYNKKTKRRDYSEKVLSALCKVGMENYIHRYPEELSGGQQQRVAIARALVNNPSVILADEPTGNLDSVNSKQVYDLLEQLNQDGKTICLITHDMDYAKNAKTLLTINDGNLSITAKAVL